MNIISLQHDYLLISLTSLSAPVKVIEKLVPDLKVVEGIEGFLTEEPEAIIAQMMTEEPMQATVMDEEVPMAAMIEEEELVGEIVAEEPMDGVWEDCE
jgi:hypothetical protein